MHTGESPTNIFEMNFGALMHNRAHPDNYKYYDLVDSFNYDVLVVAFS